MKDQPRSYKTRLADIQAWRINADNADQIAKWCGGRKIPVDWEPKIIYGVHITTYEAITIAWPGDYVVMIDGKVIVYESSIFDKLFQLTNWELARNGD